MSALHNSGWLASRSLLWDNISLRLYHLKGIINMSWEVEYTDEFEQWWEELDVDEQESVAASVGLLEGMGVHLPFPHSSGVNGSKHSKCANSAFSIKVILTGFFTPSIRAVRQFY